MALEAIADDADQAYDFAVQGRKPVQVDMRPMVRQILGQLESGEPASRISGRFITPWLPWPPTCAAGCAERPASTGSA
jgi:hypothetical protein